MLGYETRRTIRPQNGKNGQEGIVAMRAAVPCSRNISSATGNTLANAIKSASAAPHPRTAPMSRTSFASPIPIQAGRNRCGIAKTAAPATAASVHSDAWFGNSASCIVSASAAAGRTMRLGMIPRSMSIADRTTSTAAAKAPTTARSNGRVASARTTTPTTRGATSERLRSIRPSVAAGVLAGVRLYAAIFVSGSRMGMGRRFNRSQKVFKGTPLRQQRRVLQRRTRLIGDEHHAGGARTDLPRRARCEEQPARVDHDDVRVLLRHELGEAARVRGRCDRAVTPSEQQGHDGAEVPVVGYDENPQRAQARDRPGSRWRAFRRDLMMIVSGTVTGVLDPRSRHVRSVAIAQLETVAHVNAASGALSGRELEHRAGPPLRCDPPRRQLLDDVDDPQVAVKEHGVDREAHECGVDCRSGMDQHPLTGEQAWTAHETPHAPQRALGKLTDAHAAAVGQIHYELRGGHQLLAHLSPYGYCGPKGSSLIELAGRLVHGAQCRLSAS